MSKRDHGAVTIVQRGENAWRLRYRVNGKRYSVTVKGSKAYAVRRLRELLKAGDDHTHVAPDKQTVASWIDHWITIGAPGRRKKKNAGRTLERYAELLKLHVKPALGTKQLQELTSATSTGSMPALRAGFPAPPRGTCTLS
jgi:integrase